MVARAGKPWGAAYNLLSGSNQEVTPVPMIRMTEELSVSRTLISPVLKHRGKFSLFLFCSSLR